MRFDAVVIGGGPAGSVAALALARAGFGVCLIEKAEFPRRKVCGEFLSAANLPLLRRIGVFPAWDEAAGPPIRRIGLFAGEAIVASAPRRGGASAGWGRALDRARLDPLLLAAARRAGVEVLQPFAVTAVETGRDGGACIARSKTQTISLRSSVIVAAHGSWPPGPLAAQPAKTGAPTDLLAFKTHLRGCTLPQDLMPLLAFPGGYGGMVHCGGGRVSLSCCIRRDALAVCRRGFAAPRAADALWQHLRAHCRGFRAVTEDARTDGGWLAAGPVRPGIRDRYTDGVYRVGNAAGEAHPVIAEGIGMAMQSAMLLAARLTEHGKNGLDEPARERAGRAYAGDWAGRFAPRIRLSSAVARLAMQPGAAALAASVVQRAPALLALGARMSGKA